MKAGFSLFDTKNSEFEGRRFEMSMLLAVAIFNFFVAGFSAFNAVANQSAVYVGLAVFNFGLGILMSVFAAHR